MSVWRPRFLSNGNEMENPPQLSVPKDPRQQPRTVPLTVEDVRGETPAQFCYHGQSIPMPNLALNPLLVPSVPFNYPFYQMYYWPHMQTTAQNISQNTAYTASQNPFETAYQAASQYPFGTTSEAASQNPFETAYPAASQNPFGTTSEAASQNPFGATPQAALQNPFGTTYLAASQNPPQTASQSPPQTVSQTPPQTTSQTVVAPPKNKPLKFKGKYFIKKCEVSLTKLTKTEIRSYCRRKSSSPPPPVTTDENSKMSQETSLQSPIKLKIMKTFSLDNEFVALPSTNKAPWRQHAMEKLSKSHPRPPTACSPPQEEPTRSENIITSASGPVEVEEDNQELITVMVRKEVRSPNKILSPHSYKMFKSSKRPWSSSSNPSKSQRHGSISKPMYTSYIQRPNVGICDPLPIKKRPRGRPRKTELTDAQRRIKQLNLPKVVISAEDDSLFNAVIKKAQEAQNSIFRKPDRLYTSAASTTSTLSASETERMLAECETDSDTLSEDTKYNRSSKDIDTVWENKIIEKNDKTIGRAEDETQVGQEIDIIYNQGQLPTCEIGEELFLDGDDWEKILGSQDITDMLSKIIDDDFFPDIPDIQKITEDDPQPTMEQEVKSLKVTTKIESEAYQNPDETFSGTSTDIIVLGEFEAEPQFNTDVLIINAEDEELPLPPPLQE
ncbi:unnamed protein product [Orchesella dallaii]|uniref:Uncharacterized protein n=1 Tax=Orchesella dallaii TaxID=48710 RepID=A0ABP1RKL3_9HEXA